VPQAPNPLVGSGECTREVDFFLRFISAMRDAAKPHQPVRMGMPRRLLHWILGMALLLQVTAVIADPKDEARHSLEIQGYPITVKSFFHAIAANQTDIVELYLKAGVNVHVKDPDVRRDGWMGIHLASHIGSLQTVRLLLMHGADINSQAPGRWDGAPPLHLALQRGHRELAIFLIYKGADVNVRGRTSGLTMLHTAAFIGPLELVTLLIEKGARINARTALGVTPLESALRGRQSEIAEYLIQKGADLEFGRRDSPLLLAARFGHERVVKILIDRDADISTRDYASSWTPLHWAARNGHYQIASFLISQGANVNAEDKDGGTPILAAAYWGRNEIIRLLITAGADVNKRERRGNSALLNAAMTERWDTVRILISHGADVNVHGVRRLTPLMLASKRGDLELVKLLVHHGADLNAGDAVGKTALDYAEERRRKEIADFLLARGAKRSGT